MFWMLCAHLKIEKDKTFQTFPSVFPCPVAMGCKVINSQKQVTLFSWATLSSKDPRRISATGNWHVTMSLRPAARRQRVMSLFAF